MSIRIQLDLTATTVKPFEGVIPTLGWCFLCDETLSPIPNLFAIDPTDGYHGTVDIDLSIACGVKVQSTRVEMGSTANSGLPIPRIQP